MSAVTKVSGHNLEGETVTLATHRPFELSLFQRFHPECDKYSNSIELYDAFPKYFASPKQMAQLRHSGQFLSTLQRSFKHRGATYTLELTPARLKRKDGTEIESYPTAREQIVEEALRKIACDPLQGVYLNQVAGVQFTLYQLRQELARTGHSINYPDLIESLTICRRAGLTVKHEDGQTVLDSAIFPELLITSRRAWEENPRTTRCYVQFNGLVTQNLKAITYRQFDYETFMEHRKMLTRWFHKRLSHNFVNATIKNEFTIRTSTVVRDSQLIGGDQEVRWQIREVERSLQELQENGVLLGFRTEKDWQGKRILDAKHHLRPSPQFTEEMIQANKRRNVLVGEAEATGHLSHHVAENGEITYRIKEPA